MKNFTKRPIIQKIIFAIAIVMLLVNFTLAPVKVYAADDGDGGWSLGGTLAKEIMGLFTWVCDVIMSGLNGFMLGATDMGSAMLGQNNPNLTDSRSWIYANSDTIGEEDTVVNFKSGEINTNLTKWFDSEYSIPNMLYSPENIFANNIAALDINFLRENNYKSVYVAGNQDFEKDANEKSKSAVNDLRGIIASWYKSFRNIAIVGLLSVLIYLGIRILISTAASDKAKYKETLTDWVVALCLVFVIHIIMSAVLMLTDKCTEMFSGKVNNGYVVTIDGEKKDDGTPMMFRTNLMGLMRFSAQNYTASTAAVYSIMYWALVIYTCIFTFMYFRRFLYMAFFTMIAPLVALTYPIDRAGDGKAQAFNMWFKEYTMNAIIQPVHLIIYTVFVGSAYDLVAKNPLYALVALGFLVPAEKFVKKMFGLDKAESASGFGTFAGGALAMNAMKQLSNLGSGGKDKKGKGEKSDGEEDSGDNDIFMPPNDAGEMNSFGASAGAGAGAGANPPTGAPGGDKDVVRQQDQEGLDEAIEEGFGPGDSEYEKYNKYLSNNPPNNPPSPPNNTKTQPRKTSSAIGKVIGRGAGAVKRGVKRKIKSGVKNLSKVPGKAIRFTAKSGMRLAGAAALGAVSLAAGITTGDFPKAAQFVAAGALAGSSVGGDLYNRFEPPEIPIVDTARGIRNAYEEEKYGIEEATRRQRERQNAKARKNFMNDESEVKRYRQLASKMDYNGNVENLMNAAADYKEAGITDDKLIQNAIAAEYRRNKSTSFTGAEHENFIDMASFAHEKGYGSSNIEDDKKRASLENVIESKIERPQDQRAAAQTLADIFDLGDMYRNVGTLNTPKRANSPRQPKQPTQPKNNG